MKKLNTKQILIIIGIVLIIASVSANLYFCGLKIKDNIYEKGLQQGAVNITNQIKNGVRITYDTGVILFVPNQ